MHIRPRIKLAKGPAIAILKEAIGDDDCLSTLFTPPREKTYQYVNIRFEKI